MRLKSIEIEAFRVFADPEVIDLDADVVLLVGRNGFGKTSVFDAISWCLFGLSRRWRGTRDFTRAEANYLVSAFRKLEEPRVRLILSSGVEEVVAERKGSEFILVEGTTAMEGSDGEGRLLELLGFVREPGERLVSFQRRALGSFSRSFLLHQDLLSDFVTSENPRDRFNAFSELFFLTPIRDFYTHLVSERNQATEYCESQTSRLEIASAQLSQIQRDHTAEQDRIRRISGQARESGSELASRLRTLVAQVRGLLPDFAEEEENVLDLIDKSTIELGELGASQRRRLSELQSLDERIPMVLPAERECKELAVQIGEAESMIASRQRKLAEAQSEVEKLRDSRKTLEQEISIAEASIDRMHAFLSDAIEVLESDRCPVCLRPIDRDHLTSDLERRLEQADPDVQRRTAERKVKLDELKAAEKVLQRTSVELRQKQEDMQRLVARSRELQRATEETRRLVRQQLGRSMSLERARATIKNELASIRQREERLETLRAALQDIRPAFEVVEARDRLRELERNQRRQAALVRRMRETLERRAQVAETLDALISASRKAERSIIEELVSRFRGPIHESYRRLSLHPLFLELDFEFGQFAEAGELYFSVGRGDVTLNPSATFSAAQANALALAVYLALNVGQDWCPLDSALIDDPVQNLDDVNVLGLVDLLRSAFSNRQLIVSTALPHLARLLTDKFRPRAEGQRLIRHRFETLTERGPGLEKDLIEYTAAERVLPELESLSA